MAAVTLLVAASIGYFAAPVTGWRRPVLIVLGLTAALLTTLPWLAVCAAVAGVGLLWWNRRNAKEQPDSDVKKGRLSQTSVNVPR